LKIGGACHEAGSLTKTEALQNLISKIKNAIDLSSDAEEHIHSIATERQVSKGDVLIQEGQMVNKTYFVECSQSFFAKTCCGVLCVISCYYFLLFISLLLIRHLF